MSYESRAFDKPNTDGFPPDPVVVLVVTGTHDVSRLIALFAGGPVLIEQMPVGETIRAQVARHNGGKAALELLKAHGGKDFTREQIGCSEQTPCPVCLDIALGQYSEGDDCLGWYAPYDVVGVIEQALGERGAR